MTIRFIYEGAVGALTLIMIAVFGAQGGAVIALYALLPIIMKFAKTQKPDERELQLFYITGNYSMGITFVILVAVYFLARLPAFSALVSTNWLSISVSAILLAHSVIGLVTFRKEQAESEA